MAARDALKNTESRIQNPAPRGERAYSPILNSEFSNSEFSRGLYGR
jgi:hypothetical protein